MFIDNIVGLLNLIWYFIWCLMIKIVLIFFVFLGILREYWFLYECIKSKFK